MKPLNRAERNSAFLRFLLFFLITIALVVTVIFFSIEVPLAESRNLRRKIAAMKAETELSASFNDLLKQAMDELNKFGSNTESPNAINRRIKYKISDMEKILKKMPNSENSIYSLVVQNIADLNTAKLELSEAKKQ